MSDKYPGGFVTANAPAGFSVAFDGSGDYLSGVPSTAYDFGTSENYSVEFWAYLNSVPSSFAFTGGNATGAFGINYDTGGGYLKCGKGGVGNQLTTSYVLQSGQWYHIVFCRQSSTLSAFVNGTRVATTTDSTSYTATAGFIGGDTSFASMNGYLSNFRIVTGSSAYNPSSTTITVPTQLFPITNIALLTCQSPTIIDTSGNAVTLTAVGDAKVSNFTPFAAYQGFNPALGAAAGGVWTLDEAAYYQQNRQWPIYDPYFNNTTLMLHGNGTNGAQNNTFLDSSTNNFTITRNGNTTQGSFSPFSQTGWSYNGTAGAYCTLNNADYSLGTGDFTVETWMYCVDDSTYSYANICSAPSNPNFTVGFGAGGGSGARQLYVEYGGSATSIGNNMSGYLNRWTHIAVVRQSGTVTAYQNGVSLGSISKSASVGSTANLYLLRNTGDAGMDFRGYISNYRITKAAVYSSNFTPSTAPFAPISNTVLLTFQDNRFVDNSALRATVTPAGTASVQAFSPFVPAYITPTTYSNWFDGSGDYFTSPSSAAYQFDSGDFTVEAWIYFNSVGNAQFASIPVVGALYWQYYAGVLDFGNNAGGSVQASWTPVAGRWYHVASVRNGATLTHYINGVVLGSGSAFNVTATGTLQVGYGGAGTFNGLFSNFRIVKGTAVYTAAFTPPTAPLTAISGTSLLACQSSTLIDNSTNNFTLTAYGNLQPVTSPTPFPANVDTTTLNSAYSTSLIGGSGYFDGTGDYVRTPTDVAFALGTSDFTFETWLYPTVAGNDSVVIDNRNPSGGIQGFAVSWATGSVIRVIVGAPNAWDVDQSTAAVGANSWIHYALTRSGTTFRIFLNGALVYTSGAISGSMGTTAVYATVGAAYNGANPFTGYFSGTRLIKGTCLYTSSFAPPLAPLTPVTNTSVLLNYTNGAIFDNTAKNVLETVGNAQISTTQSKWGGSSMYFANGGTDYLINPYVNNPNFSFGGDFTVELWVYPTSTPDTYNCIIGNFSESGTTYGWNLMLTSGQLVHVNVAGTSNNSVQTVPLNTWSHLAITRAGSTVYIFVNGKRDTTTLTTSALAYNPVYPLRIGRQVDTTPRYFYGYMDDIRITKGVARYTTNFTPPTSQLQDQ